jgi:hypothetical protein
MKRCTKCRVEKPADLEHFYKHSASPSGLTARCKPCVNVDNHEQAERRKRRDPERERALANARSVRHYHKDVERSRALSRECAAKARRDPVRRAKINMRKRGNDAGLTIEEFDELLASQNDVCAICETDDPGKQGWNVDHCHNTGVVRFILCPECNRGLGAFRDNPAFMRKAANLIERFLRDNSLCSVHSPSLSPEFNHSPDDQAVL